MRSAIKLCAVGAVVLLVITVIALPAQQPSREQRAQELHAEISEIDDQLLDLQVEIEREASGCASDEKQFGAGNEIAAQCRESLRVLSDAFSDHIDSLRAGRRAASKELDKLEKENPTRPALAHIRLREEKPTACAESISRGTATGGVENCAAHASPQGGGGSYERADHDDDRIVVR